MVPRLPCCAHNFLSVFIYSPESDSLVSGQSPLLRAERRASHNYASPGHILTDVGRSETKIHRNTGTSLAESIFNRMKKNEENSNI